jgi:hypothetical protein
MHTEEPACDRALVSGFEMRRSRIYGCVAVN